LLLRQTDDPIQRHAVLMHVICLHSYVIAVV